MTVTPEISISEQWYLQKHNLNTQGKKESMHSCLSEVCLIYSKDSLPCYCSLEGLNIDFKKNKKICNADVALWNYIYRSGYHDKMEKLFSTEYFPWFADTPYSCLFHRCCNFHRYLFLTGCINILIYEMALRIHKNIVSDLLYSSALGLYVNVYRLAKPFVHYRISLYKFPPWALAKTSVVLLGAQLRWVPRVIANSCTAVLIVACYC